MRTTLEELIKSLKCSLEVKKECNKDCPYLLKEEIPADMIGQIPPHDIEEDGKQYWCTCNCDEMVKDAIEMLEKIPDIDKVVDELELHSFEFSTDTLPAHYVRLNDAIEIVKRGGKE